MIKPEDKRTAEGLIFLSGEEGIRLQDLIYSLQVSPDLLQDILDELEEDYRERGFHLRRYGRTVKFTADSAVGEKASQLWTGRKSRTLSAAALETLSIIAYLQPVSRTRIEMIRGVSCDTVLKNLLAADLIRLDPERRPLSVYQTTDRFLDLFDLEDLKALPDISLPEEGSLFTDQTTKPSPHGEETERK